MPDETKYGVNIDGNGTMVGLWFDPGVIQHDEKDYWFVSHDDLRRLIDSPMLDEDSGLTYVPWTDGTAVGFECRHSNGRKEFIYLNPSLGSDDGVPNVFLYQGTTGDPATDTACMHFIIDTATEP